MSQTDAFMYIYIQKYVSYIRFFVVALNYDFIQPYATHFAGNEERKINMFSLGPGTR